MIVDLVIFVIGIAVLIQASKWVIDSSITISEYTGISQLAIGFVLIAFSVSIPDFAVSIMATLDGMPQMAIGDALGSSIANICLVLGVVTLIRNIKVERSHTIDSAELMLLICIVPAVVLSKGIVGVLEGVILVAVFFLYVFFVFKDRYTLKLKAGVTKRQWQKSILVFAAAMALVIISSKFIVTSAASIAGAIGISEAVIGLTLISFGTTLPELFVDFTAIRRGQSALAIGDILGSTVVNLTLILGSIFLLSPAGGIIAGSYTIPLAFIIIASSFLFYSLVKHEGIDHKHGLVFILLYIIFIMVTLSMRTI
jgi:cation:H+ antiporter